MIAGSDRPPGLDDLTDSQLWRIDQICDGFETAWKSERRPRIEAFLDADGGPDRQLLLHELVAPRRRVPQALGRSSPDRRVPATVSRAGLSSGWTQTGCRIPLDAIAARRGRSEHWRGVAARIRSSSATLLRGHAARQLGKFQLLERVGVGGFGTVWRALDLRLNRTVALKVPHAHLIESGEEVARFLSRGQGGGPAPASGHRHGPRGPGSRRSAGPGLRLRHRNIAARPDRDPPAAPSWPRPRWWPRLPTRWHTPIPWEPFIAISSRPTSCSTPAPRGSEHGRRGRDSVWPGEPRIVDFGLAFLDQEAIHLTHDGAIIGTPAYMSPEQAAGRDSAHPIDHRTDIYSLGVVLYELLTGAIPFAGTRSEVLSRVIDSEPPSPRRLDPAVPRDLESICLKAMAKEPRHRYDSARELADDLRHFLEGEPVRARPISLWERCVGGTRAARGGRAWA